MIFSAVKVLKKDSEGKEHLVRVDSKPRCKRTSIRSKDYVGEEGMKKLLDELLPDQEIIDNGRYKWLTNPKTGYPLELDRYYPQLGIAFEFQGEQHFTPDTRYGSSYYKQRYRDKVKKRLANSRGVYIIYCTNRSLAKDTMQRKIDRASDKLSRDSTATSLA